jgi:glutathione S-transferase
MSLTLWFHPLSSFCMKALVGLYELEVPFERRVVDLSKEDQRAALLRLWPMGRFPVLRDEARGRTVAESNVILEYLDGASGRLVPSDPERARECRFRDRCFDLYVNATMQKIVTDKLRPEGKHDPYGVEKAREDLEAAYGLADGWLREGPWAVGETFTMADCAAAPALFFARQVAPFGERRHLAAYHARLAERPSVARVLEEAKPYLSMFPG